MKKIFLYAGIAFIACFAFLGCSGQKKQGPSENVQEKIDTLTAEVKAQAIELLKSIADSNMNVIPKVDVLAKDNAPVEHFVPLDWAEKAQTLAQKWALLGCYRTDNMCDKFIYGGKNNAKERQAVLAKLYADCNVDVMTANFIDSIYTLSNEDFIKTANETLNKAFNDIYDDEALQHFVICATYATMESTILLANFKAINGKEKDAEIIAELKRDEKNMKAVIDLVQLVTPYFKGLRPLARITSKMKDIVNAPDEDVKNKARMEYYNSMKDMRADFDYLVGGIDKPEEWQDRYSL